MKTYQCSIDISAKSLEEAELVFYDLTKHWSNIRNRKVYEVISNEIPMYSEAQLAELDRLNGRTKQAEREK